MAATTEWPASEIESRAVADLVPYAHNPRSHSPHQVDQIAASIEQWGWTNPVLIDEDGGIIAGHGRVMAAQQLALDRVPCMVAKGWTEEQKRAYVIADNQLTLNGAWDTDTLRLEVSALQLEDFNLDLLGFDDDVLVNLLEGPIPKPALW